MTRVVWSIGSNLGDRLEHLRLAVRGLAAFDGLDVVALSGVYETAPWGPVPQDDFLNAVVVTEHVGPGTEATPETLLGLAHVLEATALRERRERWGPRTLDVDLVAVGDTVLDRPELTLPHPRARERAFVLVPWADADPAAVLPGHGPVTGLIAALPDADVAGVRARADLRILP